MILQFMNWIEQIINMKKKLNVRKNGGSVFSTIFKEPAVPKGNFSSIYFNE